MACLLRWKLQRRSSIPFTAYSRFYRSFAHSKTVYSRFTATKWDSDGGVSHNSASLSIAAMATNVFRVVVVVINLGQTTCGLFCYLLRPDLVGRIALALMLAESFYFWCSVVTSLHCQGMAEVPESVSSLITVNKEFAVLVCSGAWCRHLLFPGPYTLAVHFSHLVTPLRPLGMALHAFSPSALRLGAGRLEARFFTRDRGSVARAVAASLSKLDHE